jgi:hypothetical protein
VRAALPARRDAARDPQRAEASGQVSGIHSIVVGAALLETLMLLGGLYWAATASPGVSVGVRVTVVVALAVAGAAVFALAAVRAARPRG